ncbi:hypothetical protein BCY91_02185 [Pelobium manganitolerans]|uniref:Nucleotidyltransferase n=1 Tax=Pelobium manganitolerans TaxID=1842495 RepID=A0A419SCW1_9SPHI|nr:hypothetical protein BCY91_02185 [Pelobium manganitolerans]
MDAIKNGKIQKFEYCAELAWKTAKIYLEIKTGNMAMSPKAVYKSLFLNGLIDEGHYKLLFATVEDRNKLSHIYKEEMYDDVYKNLKTHLTALQNLVNVFNRP